MLHEDAQAQSAPDGHHVSILTIPSPFPTGRDVPARHEAAHHPPRPQRPQPDGGEELAHQGVASMQANNLWLAGRFTGHRRRAWLAAARSRRVKLLTLCGRGTPLHTVPSAGSQCATRIVRLFVQTCQMPLRVSAPPIHPPFTAPCAGCKPQPAARCGCSSRQQGRRCVSCRATVCCAALGAPGHCCLLPGHGESTHMFICPGVAPAACVLARAVHPFACGMLPSAYMQVCLWAGSTGAAHLAAGRCAAGAAACGAYRDGGCTGDCFTLCVQADAPVLHAAFAVGFHCLSNLAPCPLYVAAWRHVCCPVRLHSPDAALLGGPARAAAFHGAGKQSRLHCMVCACGCCQESRAA